MNRREFLTTSLVTGAAGLTFNTISKTSVAAPSHRFGLCFAPHFGTFKCHAGDDPLDQMKFMADRGFRAVEDVGLRHRPRPLQERIRREAERHGIQIGLFAGTADFGNPTFTSGCKADRSRVYGEIRRSVEVAKRTGARWCGVVPGKRDSRLPMAVQTANTIDALRYCAELCEPTGLVMVLEPIHHAERGFLRDIRQAYRLCKAVGSPSCKLLFDVYHQQSADGKLIESIDTFWSEIAYFQLGDYPGRKEPGTGNIDYGRLLKHIRQKGFDGLLGMEHGNSQPGKPGELLVIDAYVRHDCLSSQ